MTLLPQKQYTLSEWILKWIDTYAPVTCRSGVTLERYQRLATYLDAADGIAHALIDQLTHQPIEDALLTLLKAPAQRKEHLSVRSVHHVAGLISSALGKAARMGLIPVNPMSNVELPAAENAEARSLTTDEISRLRKVCRGEWTQLFVEMALATGLRRGELLALTNRDIDRTTRVLSVSRSLEETKKGLRLKHTKSGRSRRCTLPQSVMLLLPAAERKPDELLFPDRDGGWRRPVIVSQLIARRIKQAGIQHASLHSLRHTHASQLLSRGMPLPAVSARLGHADPAVTLRIYSHTLPPDDARLAEEWDRILAIL